MRIRSVLISVIAATCVAVAPSAMAADPAPSKPLITPMKKPSATPAAATPLPGASVPGAATLPRPGTVPVRVGCPDPAVQLRVGWPGRNADGTYSFQLLASIVNKGAATFRSNRNQTQIALYEGGRMLKTEAFTSNRATIVEYAPGQGGSHVYAVERWNPASEFLDEYRAQISYDPDVRVDGNPDNDDCRAANNATRLSVIEIRRVLEALPR
jgi:hypothetical protein